MHVRSLCALGVTAALLSLAGTADAKRPYIPPPPPPQDPPPFEPPSPPPPPPPTPPPVVEEDHSNAIPIAATTPSPAPPQPYYMPPPPPPAPERRSNLVAGFSIGLGVMGCNEEGCEGDSGIALGGHLGGFVTRRVAIVANLSLISVQDEVDGYSSVNTTRTSVGVGARVWAAPRFWIEGGIGRASLTARDDYDSYDSDHVVTFFGAVGYELKHTPKFAIDIHLRGGIEEYDGYSFAANSLEVGFSWF